MHLHLFLPYCWQRVNLQELSFVFESLSVVFSLIWRPHFIYCLNIHYWYEGGLLTALLNELLLKYYYTSNNVVELCFFTSNLLSIRSFKACACQIIAVLSPLYYRGAVNGPMQVSWYMGTGISPNTITAEFFHSGCKTSLCWDMERISLEELVYYK